MKPAAVTLPIFIVLASCFAACDDSTNSFQSRTKEQPPTPHSDTITPSVPKAPDPVTALKTIMHTVSPDKEYQVSPSEANDAYRRNDMLNTRWKYEPSGFDVQKTASLVSPYVGYIMVTEFQNNPAHPDWSAYRSFYRATFAWQENRWVGKEIERKKEGESWDTVPPVYIPNARLLRNAFKGVNWE